jgi:hypothetical protein
MLGVAVPVAKKSRRKPALRIFSAYRDRRFEDVLTELCLHLKQARLGSFATQLPPRLMNVHYLLMPEKKEPHDCEALFDSE